MCDFWYFNRLGCRQATGGMAFVGQSGWLSALPLSAGMPVTMYDTVESRQPQFTNTARHYRICGVGLQHAYWLDNLEAVHQSRLASFSLSLFLAHPGSAWSESTPLGR